MSKRSIVVCGEVSATCGAGVAKRGKAVACGKPAFASFVDETDESGEAWPLCARHLYATLRRHYKLRPLGESKD